MHQRVQCFTVRLLSCVLTLVHLVVKYCGKTSAILWRARVLLSCISPRMSSPGPCCGSAGSGSHPWPVSAPSPAWTGPPCHAGCTCSPAAAQGTQRTCTSGHSPRTSPAYCPNHCCCTTQRQTNHSSGPNSRRLGCCETLLSKSVRAGEKLKKKVMYNLFLCL